MGTTIPSAKSCPCKQPYSVSSRLFSASGSLHDYLGNLAHWNSENLRGLLKPIASPPSRLTDSLFVVDSPLRLLSAAA